ncbi:4'-phosphopantetheinyl transferase family protein [Streptomyces lusitanus]|uniref:4'-phosphopantetheinyl transferase superfamily protein n=1 Tax=Streptomyces lusitanus TaxID=68232 RepID=A0ABU3JLQ0_9ACTN|nr:4'-phosphopantetheinyl transferase superfamily protein [Streptomyces lusitanus]
MELWWWRHGTPAPEGFTELLDAPERARAAAFRFPAHRARFIRARALTKRIVGTTAGVPARDVRLIREPCPCCGGTGHGPLVAELADGAMHLSLSHSEEYSALLLSPRHPVGLDIELLRPMPVDVLAPTTLSADELAYVAEEPAGRRRWLAYLRCWTRKEAVLKAVGTGVVGDLTELDVRPRERTARVSRGTGRRGGDWRVSDLLPAPGLLAAVARPAGGPDEPVMTHRADAEPNGPI